MDPIANIFEATELARAILANPNHGAKLLDGARLAELVIAMHDWRSNGGFDPYADPDAPVVDPQANALLRICTRNEVSHVIVKDGAAALPDGYVFVVECQGGKPSGFECGIAPDGRVSS